MKKRFVKWLSALLISAMLLPSFALSEGVDTPSGYIPEASEEYTPTETRAEDAYADAGGVADAPVEAGDPAPVEVTEPAADDTAGLAADGAEDEDEEDFFVEIAAEPVDQVVSEVAFASLDEIEEYGEQMVEFDNAAMSGVADDGSVAIDTANFPDETFRNYVASQFDSNEDGVLSVSEIDAVKQIYLDNKNVSSLKGIEYFTALTNLYVSSNQLTELDLSAQVNLKYLYCNSNKLTALDVSHCPDLEEFGCNDNQLNALDVSSCKGLTYINCDNNNIEHLDVNNCTNLVTLSCEKNKLTGLDVSCCPKLNTLFCVGNRFTTLDIANCPELLALVKSEYKQDEGYSNGGVFYKNEQSFYMLRFDTKVNLMNGGTVLVAATDIPIDEAHFPDANFRQYLIETFDADDGYLRQTQLTRTVRLEPSGNITSLQGIELFTRLIYLICPNNNISSLDLSGLPSLCTLNCVNNPLKELDISNNPELIKIMDRGIKTKEGDIVRFENSSESIMAFNKDIRIVANDEALYEYSIDGHILYDIAVDTEATSFGSIETARRAAEGSTVEITVTPYSGNGFTVASVSVQCGDEVVEVTRGSGNSYSFIMPEGDVTVSATFKFTPYVYSAPAAIEGLVYDGTMQRLLRAGYIEGGTPEYSVDGETWSSDIPTAKDAGSYSVYYRVAGDDQYVDLDPVEIDVEIAKQPLIVTITADDSKVYGTADPALTYEANGLIGGDALPELAREEGENTGSYTYMLKGNDDFENNYDVTVKGTLTITPRPVALEWGDLELTYSGYAQKPTAKVREDDLSDGDTCAVTVAGEAVEAGDHIAEATSLSNANYKLPDDTDSRKVAFSIEPAKHADVEATVNIAYKDVVDAQVDLSAYLTDGDSWEIKPGTEPEGMIDSAAFDDTYQSVMTYTARPIERNANVGRVVVEIYSTNYEVYHLTVNFVVSDVFALSFDSQGGVQAPGRKLQEGAAYGKLPEVTKAGYEFVCWSTNPDDETGRVTDESLMGAGDTTLYAIWKINDFTITLEPGSHGKSPKAEDYKEKGVSVEGNVLRYTVKSEPFDLPVFSDEDTCSFAGWRVKSSPDAQPQIHVTIDPAEVQGDFTYEAQWVEAKATGTVGFVDSPNSSSALQGVPGNLEDDLKTSMKEIACADAAKVLEDDESGSVEVAVNMSISASSTDEDAIKAINKLTDENAEADFLEIKITRTVTVDGEEETSVRSEVSDTARVVEIPLQYNMTGRYDPVVYRYHGDDATALDRLSSRPRDGQYEDGSYYVSGAGESAVIYVYSRYFSTYAVGISRTPSYKVMFESNGGSSVAPLTLNGTGSTATRPADPTRARSDHYGYYFDGWYTNRNCTNPYDFAAVVDADITLYAGWKEMLDEPVNVPEALTCTYDGAAHGFSAPYSGTADITIYYSTETELTADNYEIGSTEIPSFTNAGTYTVYWFAHAVDCLPSPMKGAARITIDKANPTIKTAPKAGTLTYNGKAQALIEAGAATNGTMLYKLGNGQYGTAIPTATNADTYTVYYMVQGDRNYADIVDEAKYKLTVTIKKVETPAPATGSSTSTGSTGTGATTVSAPAPVPASEPTLTIPGVKKSNKATVNVGTTYQIDTANAAAKSFKSSNKKVATVTSTGLVIPNKKGKVNITFKVGKKKRTIKLTVKDPTIPTKVYLNLAGTVAAKVGESQTLTVTLPEGTTSAIKWKSSNKKIATVNNGVVIFKKAGTVTITATATRGKKKAKVKFKVSK